jgi:hypothetical protein
MCEWCDRLCLRNYKWDNHANWRGMWYMFKRPKNNKYKIDEYWRRGGAWVEAHSKNGFELARRHYGRGWGSRYYDRV